MHVTEASLPLRPPCLVIMHKCHQYRRSGQEVPHQMVELSQNGVYIGIPIANHIRDQNNPLADVVLGAASVRFLWRC